MNASGITVQEATRHGVKAFLIYCAGHGCTHCGHMPASILAPDLRPSALEPRCRCTACGHLGASIRPDYSFWTK